MGVPFPREYIEAAKAHGASAVGLTERATCRGHVAFQEAAKDGFKPIFGVQIPLVQDMRGKGATQEQRDAILKDYPRDLWHEANRVIDETYGSGDRNAQPEWITLWALDSEGLHNLWRISSLSCTEGFYYRPRVDLACLREYSAGVAVGTGGFQGVIGTNVARGRVRRIEGILKSLHETFGERLFFEVQPIGLLAACKSNAYAVQAQQRFPGSSLLATVDPYYINKEDVEYHRVYASFSSTTPPDESGMPGDDFYFMSESEVRAGLARDLTPEQIDAAINATVTFADKCTAKVKIDKVNCFVPDIKPLDVAPNYPLGDDFVHIEEIQYFDVLKFLCSEGWSWRSIDERATFLKIPLKTYQDRLEMEIAALESRKFISYILVVFDIYRFARTKGIYVGPGRGSGAGSLVNYLLGITSVDPIEHGLLFERFISPARLDMPDIDMDFESFRRGEIVEYIREKYGSAHVAQIATWSRLKGRAALSEVCKKLDVHDPAIKAIGRKIDELSRQRKAGDARYFMTIVDACEEDFAADFKRDHPDVIRMCAKLEGRMRHSAKHAAAVVASPIPIIDIAPLESVTDSDGGRVSIISTDMNGAAALSLLKLDALGLKQMGIIRLACEAVTAGGSRLSLSDLESMSLDDPKVIQAFTNGSMYGVFQFDTPGAMRACKGLRFRNFNDIASMNAINRPGTLGSGMDTEFVKRCNDPEKAAQTIYHAKIDAITSDSVGVIVYQEQVNRIMIEVAGFDPGAADNLRRVISKSKGREALEAQRGAFLTGVQVHTPDMALDVANRLWDQICDFGRYSFNKSHAVAYAMIAYWCQWLKVHYPLEFWMATLSAETDKAKAAAHIRHAKIDGVQVLGPDVSVSGHDLSIDRRHNAIRGSLLDIKGVGPKAVSLIVSQQPFESLEDFAEKTLRGKVKVNKTAGRALIQSGAMDSLIDKRKPWIDDFDSRWEALKKAGASFDDDDAQDYDDDEAAQIAAEVSSAVTNDRFGTLMERVKVTLVDMDVDDFMSENEDKGLVWVRATAEPARFGYVGEYEQGELDEETKARMGYGRQTASLFVEGANGAKIKVKIEADECERYREILSRNKSMDLIIGGSVGRKYKGHQPFKLRYLVALEDLQASIKSWEPLTFEQALIIGEHPIESSSATEAQLKVARGDFNAFVAKIDKFYQAKGKAVSATFVGAVGWLRQKNDKNGNAMAWIGVVNTRGEAIEAVAFSSTWKRYCGTLNAGSLVSLTTSYKGDGFFVDSITVINPQRPKRARENKKNGHRD